MHSYTHLQIEKPYIALNAETYISLRQQELRTCKRIGYEFYCKELFVVKHKTSYSCESAIYFNLETHIIKENFQFSNSTLTKQTLTLPLIRLLSLSLYIIIKNGTAKTK